MLRFESGCLIRRKADRGARMYPGCVLSRKWRTKLLIRTARHCTLLANIGISGSRVGPKVTLELLSQLTLLYDRTK